MQIVEVTDFRAVFEFPRPRSSSRATVNNDPLCASHNDTPGYHRSPVPGTVYFAEMGRPVGRWRIVEMDLWDRDAIELLGPAFIELRVDGTGSFRFIAVAGDLDCRYDERRPEARAEFTWEGDDEGSHVSGRGWAEIEADGSLRGHIFFHLGDDSTFRAVAEANL